MSRTAAAVLAALLAAPLSAQDLGYSYVDIGAVVPAPDVAGTQAPVPGQTVTARSGEGEGLLVGGSLGIGERFFAAGSFSSAVVDVDATIASPLTTVTVADNYDLVRTRVGFGYVRELAGNLDLVAALSYETVDYDFGSFAGENFDVDHAGAGLELGARWSPRPRLELFAFGRISSVGEADLATGTADRGAELEAGVRWTFFEDLGLAVAYANGDVEALNLSMRFGFGDLRWQLD